jgi:hypothetical protein
LAAPQASPLHETRNRTVAFGLVGQEGLHMFGDDLIEKAVFGMARLVDGGRAHAPDRKARGRPTLKR